MARLRKRLCLSTTQGVMALGSLLLVAVLILSGCTPPFRRNPNLTLLRQRTSSSVYCPVWSPDGQLIYFLLQTHSGYDEAQLRVIRPDGLGERLVLDGGFGSMCISPDGARLAVVSLVTAAKDLGGTLLLVDTSGQVLDTLSAVGDTVVSARFGSSGRSLYYYLRGRGVLKLDLETRQVDTVLLAYIYPSQDFDVWNDSLLLMPSEVCHIMSGRADTLPVVLWQPRFCPANPTIVSGALMSSPYDYLDELVLVNRTSDSVTHLDARAYSECEITDPNWSPDGKSIVMAAAPWISGGFLDPVLMLGGYNLWVLKR
jgi:hypothetical protein